jgi:hypothetical protein
VRAPFFHRLVGSVLGHLLQDRGEEVSATGEEQSFTATEDLAVRGLAGGRLDLTGQGEGLLDDKALKFGIDGNGGLGHGVLPDGVIPHSYRLPKKAPENFGAPAEAIAQDN